MKSHVQAVVIGGGVVGCSVLYHLARHGWADVMLVERDELTSGSTWHAAGGMHTINGDPNVAKLQKYTISLYREIEELSGQATGVHVTGGVLLAATEARMDWLRGVVAKGRYLGLDISRQNVDHLSARFGSERVRYQHGDAEVVDIDDRFDLFFSSLTLKHLFPTFEKALAQAWGERPGPLTVVAADGAEACGPDGCAVPQ